MMSRRVLPVGLVTMAVLVLALINCLTMAGELKKAPVYEGATISGMTPFKTKQVNFMVPPGWVADVPADQQDQGMANWISGKKLSARVQNKDLGATILVYRWKMAKRENLHEFLLNLLNDNIMDNTPSQSVMRVLPDKTFPVFETYTGELIEKGEPVSVTALLAWRWVKSSRHYALFCVYPTEHADKVQDEIIALVKTLK